MKPNHHQMRDLQIQFETRASRDLQIQFEAESPRSSGTVKFNLKRKVSAVKLNFTIPLALLLLTTTTHAQRRLDLSQWQMVWNDEFSYTGTQAQVHYQMFDAPGSKWSCGFPWGQQYWGTPLYNQQYQKSLVPNVMTRDMVNVTGGNLELRAAKSAVLDAYSINHQGNIYYSDRKDGFITSNYFKDLTCWGYHGEGPNGPISGEIPYRGFAYGAFEIRAKLPDGPRDYPAFWLWGGNWVGCMNDGGINHVCGTPTTPQQGGGYDTPGYEIDIFECDRKPGAGGITDDDYVYHVSVQPNVFSNPPCWSCQTFYKWNNKKPWEEFHTYSVVWTPTDISFFIDGNEIRTQHDGVPPIAMILLLTNAKHQEGTASPLVIDYVRVYRPNGYNYNTFPYSPTWSAGGPFLWQDYRDQNFQTYKDNYATKPYASKNFKRLSQLEHPYASSPVEKSVRSATMIDNASSIKVFYHQGDGALRSVSNLRSWPSTGQINSFPAISPPLWASPFADNVHPQSSLSNEYYGGSGYNIFYRGINNDVWVYQGSTDPACTWCNRKISLDPNNLYPNDVAGGVYFAQGQGLRGPRVYYKNTSNKICFFEWTPNCTPNWRRVVTNISTTSYDTEDFLVTSSGELYFTRDLNIYVVTSTEANPCAASTAIWTESLVYNHASLSPSPILTPFGGMHLHPIQNKIYGALVDPWVNYFYLNNPSSSIPTTLQGHITQWVRNSNGTYTATIMRELSDVRRIVGVRATDEGRDEIYYISSNGKLKTYYQRAAPLINGQAQWQSSTIDVFSPFTYINVPGITSTAMAFDVDPRSVAITRQAAFEPPIIYCNGRSRPGGTISLPNQYWNVFSKIENAEVAPPAQSARCNYVWHGSNDNVYSGVEFRNTLNNQPPAPETPALKVVPNPNEGSFRIEGLDESKAVASFIIFDALGQKVEANGFSRTGEISIHNSQPGIYFIQLRFEDNTSETIKFIVN